MMTQNICSQARKDFGRAVSNRGEVCRRLAVGPHRLQVPNIIRPTVSYYHREPWQDSVALTVYRF